MQKLKVTIQHFHGCPNSTELVKRVRIAIKGLEQFIEYQVILVESDEMAEKIHFRGSPTLLINGEDFEYQPEPQHVSLSCRLYLNGLPALEEIRNRIKFTLNLKPLRR
jgi:hypothetical protein